MRDVDGAGRVFFEDGIGEGDDVGADGGEDFLEGGGEGGFGGIV